MVTFHNFLDNDNVNVIEERGGIKIIEYKKDLSVQPSGAVTAYFASEMNVRKRQAFIELKGSSYTTSAGAMQWMAGSVQAAADIKGVGDFLGKALKGAVTKESTVKPKYEGTGFLMLEPTYKHLLIEEVADWGAGIVLEDGLFLACDSNVQLKVAARTNLSSAALGNEGLFNLCLKGRGLAVLESPVPREELIAVDLDDDQIRIDGDYAIAWSSSLDFRIEKSTKSLLGSAVSGEGLVNVYRGTGRVLIAPIA
ncbi:MAG TPA: AIM24 family protein [Candidatus Pelethocola excrementipullorum]|nr:AIM24 family protein [Candidatus Pelethocola excrementipullorum]